MGGQRTLPMRTRRQHLLWAQPERIHMQMRSMHKREAGTHSVSTSWRRQVLKGLDGGVMAWRFMRFCTLREGS